MKQNKNIVRLNDVISDWDSYRLESMQNMFYQIKHGSKNSQEESINNYKFAMQKYTELFQKRLYLKNRYFFNDY